MYQSIPAVPGRRAAVAALLLAAASLAAAPASQNHAPNPYRVAAIGWGQLPEGRSWGSTSAVFPARDGSGDIWVAERCGQNNCTGREELDPVLRFDADGNLLQSFGAGLIVMPHGIFVDADHNVWVTDTGTTDDGRGHQVHKFSPAGEVLMTLGTPGGVGDGPDAFEGPSDVLVAPDGSIFVAVGHLGRGERNRIVKFAPDGTFLTTWGRTGTGNDEFHDPHALAMDSRGRLFVGDRYNNRVQIFDQEGQYLATWTQFGRPSGLFIDADDVLYSADSESNDARNPGWERGVRIGSVADGRVDFFIPDQSGIDPNEAATSGAEGVAADASGNVYGAEVNPRGIRRYARR